MKNWINNKLVDLQARSAADDGQGVVEYAVVLGVVVVGIVGFWNATPIDTLLSNLVAEVSGLMTT